MDHLLPPGIIDEFPPEDVLNMSGYVDDCACHCRVHFSVQDGLLNVHGRPIFERLLVRGNLSLIANEEIRRLPDFLAVTGSVFLTGCSKLEVMPSRLYAGEIIRLEETNIRELPGTLVAGRAIHIDDCPNVRSIPAGVRTCVFRAAGCTKLTEVAEGVEFNTLDLSDTPIEELPSELTIKNELKLRNCARLSRIPEGVIVHAGIDVRGCDMLFTLPRSIQPRVAVTDGMMLANDWVVVPQMTAEEASMCLGAKGIDAFPHRHFKNLARMQDAVTTIEPEGKGLCRGRAVGVLKSSRVQPPQRDRLRQLIARLDERSLDYGRAKPMVPALSGDDRAEAPREACGTGSNG